MTSSLLFQANNIKAGYDNKIILNDINLVVPSNKISVIIGENGCGKSTLLKTLARLIKPSSGEIVLNGKKITEFPAKQRARV